MAICLIPKIIPLVSRRNVSGERKIEGDSIFLRHGPKDWNILIGEIKNLFDFMLKLFQRISSNIEGRLLKRLNLKQKYMN